MKSFLFVLLSVSIGTHSIGQALNKHGQVTGTTSEYVSSNGALGIFGVDKNGSLVILSGNALDFDGQDDYVSLPSGVYFNGDFTIECWVYPRSFPNWARIIDFGNGAGVNNVLLAYTFGNSGAPGLYVEGGQFAATQTLPLNQWSHIAATMSGTTATIYINGVAAGTATLPVPANVTRNSCYIGKSNWGDPGPNAAYDELRIWNTARTPAEIQSSMNGELTGTEPGLVAYYNFDQGTAGGANTGTTNLTDKSAHVADGTLNNFSLTGNTSNWVYGFHF